MTLPPNPPRGKKQRAPATTPGNPPNIRSEDLMQGTRCLTIEHGDAIYCLRITRNERLILTKL